MSIDDLDEDEDEISSDATEVSLDDEAGFEENLQILSKKSLSSFKISKMMKIKM